LFIRGLKIKINIYATKNTTWDKYRINYLNEKIGLYDVEDISIKMYIMWVYLPDIKK